MMNPIYKKNTPEFKEAKKTIKFLLKNKNQLYKKISLFAESVREYMKINGYITFNQFTALSRLEIKCKKFLEAMDLSLEKACRDEVKYVDIEDNDSGWYNVEHEGIPNM